MLGASGKLKFRQTPAGIQVDIPEGLAPSADIGVTLDVRFG
jgi:hypothetical protein